MMTAEERAYNYASTQKPTKLQVGEIAKHYNNGYNQAFEDFMEKACDYLQKNLWRVAIEDGEFRQRFVTDFKNYMRNEI